MPKIVPSMQLQQNRKGRRVNSVIQPYTKHFLREPSPHPGTSTIWYQQETCSQNELQVLPQKQHCQSPLAHAAWSWVVLSISSVIPGLILFVFFWEVYRTLTSYFKFTDCLESFTYVFYIYISPYIYLLFSWCFFFHNPPISHLSCDCSPGVF